MRSLLLAIILPLLSTFAVAEQPNYCVKIKHEYGKFTNNGSGSLISPTLVLTCDHNVGKDKGNTFVVFKNGDRVEAKIVARNPRVDLLILELPKVRYEQPIKLAKRRAQPEDVVVIKGFPGIGDRFQTYTGEVVNVILSIGGVYDSAYRVLGPAAPQGVSGSPAVNEQGELVGVQWGSFPGTGNRCTHIDHVHKLLERIK